VIYHLPVIFPKYDLSKKGGISMRRTLYLLLPSIETCKNLVSDLQKARLEERYIHVLAREDIPLDNLHKASLWQRSELRHGIELGLSVGGIAGFLGGILAVSFPPAGIALGGGAILLGSLLSGAGFGTVVSALVAADLPNHELELFEKSIAGGQILLILDVPTSRMKSFCQLIHEHIPDADIRIALLDHSQPPRKEDAEPLLK
jgi:hypothetical protein